MSRYLRVAVYTRSRQRVHLEVCPACGYNFDRDEDRHEHIAAHDPSDFGLSPLGETAPDHDAPLFAGGHGD